MKAIVGLGQAEQELDSLFTIKVCECECKYTPENMYYTLKKNSHVGRPTNIMPSSSSVSVPASLVLG